MTGALAAVALAVIVGAAVAGCGDDDESSAPSSTELTITLAVEGTGEGAPADVATVSCPGGEPAVCAAIDDLPADSAAPTPPETPCTEIYGGPDTVTIEGTLRGEPIDAELTRINGCEIARFDRFAVLLEAAFPGYEPGSALAP